MKVCPLKKNILLIPNEMLRKLPSGIILAESVRQGAVIEGKVIDVGSEVREIKAGQEVIFDKHSATLREIRVDLRDEGVGIDSQRFFIMQECDVLAVKELIDE